MLFALNRNVNRKIRQLYARTDRVLTHARRLDHTPKEMPTSQSSTLTISSKLLFYSIHCTSSSDKPIWLFKIGLPFYSQHLILSTFPPSTPHPWRTYRTHTRNRVVYLPSLTHSHPLKQPTHYFDFFKPVQTLHQSSPPHHPSSLLTTPLHLATATGVLHPARQSAPFMLQAVRYHIRCVFYDVTPSKNVNSPNNFVLTKFKKIT